MRFSAEWWEHWLGNWAVGLAAVAALLAVGRWYFAGVVKAEERERSAQEKIELEKRIGQRSITERQRSMVVTLLKGSPPGIFSISTVMGDVEGQEYGRRIAAMLVSAEWKESRESGEETNPRRAGDELGIVVGSIQSGPSGALLMAFSAAAIPFVVREEAGFPLDTVAIFISPRPK